MAGRERWIGKIRQRAQHSMFARRVTLPVSRVMRVDEIAGGPLVVAALIALIWANAGPGFNYETAWGAELTLRIAEFSITESARHWVNDLLMPLFFFVAGLEIKRELVWGVLSSWKRAAFPVLTALGAMLVPAGLYLAFNLPADGGDSAWRGWGVPVATDIAFALAVLALLGSRIPPQLKILLLAYAVVDDVGGIIIIAVFYSQDLYWVALGVAVAAFALIGILQRLGVYSMWVYWALGVVAVLAMLESGVHTTIAGVLLGLMAPAHAAFTREQFTRRTGDLMRRFEAFQDKARRSGETAEGSSGQQEVLEDQQTILGQLEELVNGSDSPVDRLSRWVNPWVNYLVLPLFALANAGVAFADYDLAGVIGSPIVTGVLIALVVGKPLGFVGVAWLATTLGVARPPEQVHWKHIFGIGLLGGMGFTISLFIAELAFASGEGLGDAKIGVLVASAVAGLAGYLVLLLTADKKSSAGT